MGRLFIALKRESLITACVEELWCVRVSHRDGPEELKRKGRVCEREALARGVKLHLEGRVCVHGQKTVVFP